MVNSKEFAKRLTQVLEYYDISATALAEKMDIQRSSISHLLSERNKPSLDFVLKLLKLYPEIELYWLLNGEGSFPTKAKAAQSNNTPTLFSEDDEKKSIKNSQLPLVESLNITTEELERIVLFFKDGSFKSYSQKKLP